MSLERPRLLGDLEMAVMEYLWGHGSSAPKDVHQALGNERQITHNTVQSTLKRLHEKGLLRRDKVSHSYVYEPRLGRLEFRRELLGAVVDHLTGGDGADMVATFVDLTARAGEGELRRLRAMVTQCLADRDGAS